jgi:hypothetical protein
MSAPEVAASELDAANLPVGTVVRSDFGVIHEKDASGYWLEMGSPDLNGLPTAGFPVAILYVPAPSPYRSKP